MGNWTALGERLAVSECAGLCIFDASTLSPTMSKEIGYTVRKEQGDCAEHLEQYAVGME
jgi:hypothetical protein